MNADTPSPSNLLKTGAWPIFGAVPPSPNVQNRHLTLLITATFCLKKLKESEASSREIVKMNISRVRSNVLLYQSWYALTMCNSTDDGLFQTEMGHVHSWKNKDKQHKIN